MNDRAPMTWQARIDNPAGAARMDAARAESARVNAERDATLRRDDGMARADDHASPRWKREAWDFLMAYLVDHVDLFVDDLWDAGLPHTDEDRALGPLFSRAARNGFIEKTGEYRKSVRSNLTEKPVWRSRIYKPVDL